MIQSILQKFPAKETAHGHCDGPCGVYDPSQARVAAEAVLSMTKKIMELECPGEDDNQKWVSYQNTLIRYIQIKEQEAENAKHHLLVLWTDYFKPEHVEKYPELHEIFWKASKAASACKHEVSIEHAQELLDFVQKVHTIFWETKGRDVEWTLAVA